MKDYIGKRFGRLIVLEEVERVYTQSRASGFKRFLCKCDCGNIGKYFANGLGKHTQSCGCFRKDVRTKTGLAIDIGNGKHPMYSARSHLKNRCNNKNDKSHKNYGGRGITYDPRREKFENFYEDMKEGREKGLTLDRIDNNGNYYKENCRRATWKVQANNKRYKKYEGKTIKERAEIWGVGYKKARLLVKHINDN